jgi:hypothetical protein
MAEEAIEVGALCLPIGPPRRKRRPDDRVERLVLEPSCNRPENGLIRFRQALRAIVSTVSTHPCRLHLGCDFLANTELRDGLLETPDGKWNPMGLDLSCRRVDDQRDSSILRDSGKLDWKPWPIIAKCARPR